MRFHFGKMAPDAGFKPADAGWTRLQKSGSIWRTQLAALPAGVVVTALTLAAWLKFAPPKPPHLVIGLLNMLKACVAGILQAVPWASHGVFSVLAVWALTALVAVVLLALAVLPSAVYFLVHELVHAAVTPSFGLTDRSVIGLWPAGGVAYSHYEGEMSRERWILMLLMPFLVLSVLPFGVAAVSGSHSPYFAALSVVNAIGSYVDLYNAGYVFLRVPARASVRLAGDGIWLKGG